jgi:hypothetical protein
MPRIADGYTYCAVYIYASLDDAKHGEQYGGSGFVASVSLTENPEWIECYVVTNWHVVLLAKTPVIRINRRDGKVEYIETKLSHWFRHPDGDDIAVIPIDVVLAELQVWTVGVELFVTPKIVFDEDIGIGDDTVMIGRFVNHEGKQKNSPAVRFGNIAMMTEEKIVTESGLTQEALLVEVRSLPGYSGSAVFIYSPCAMNDMSRRRQGRKKGEWPEGNNPNQQVTGTGATNFQVPNFDHMNPKGPYLLGIDFCHINRKANVLTAKGKKVEDELYVNENTGMAGVIPAWKIAEVLNIEELRQMRDREDRKITEKKTSSGVSLDAAIAEEPMKIQHTEQGEEIPIPATDQFFSDLEKASHKKT